MARGQSHGLGFGKGSMIDYGQGLVEYRQTGKLLPAFKVNVADVIGLSVRKATKQDRKNGANSLQQVFVVQGGGTELATVAVNYGTAEKIEAWLRAHPLFRDNAPQTAPRRDLLRRRPRPTWPTSSRSSDNFETQESCRRRSSNRRSPSCSVRCDRPAIWARRHNQTGIRPVSSRR
jgi:hypothetical protein